MGHSNTVAYVYVSYDSLFIVTLQINKQFLFFYLVQCVWVFSLSSAIIELLNILERMDYTGSNVLN